ncbi:hypothetical protein AB0E55_19430 [Amycolatopsis keratiniphila]
MDAVITRLPKARRLPVLVRFFDDQVRPATALLADDSSEDGAPER